MSQRSRSVALIATTALAAAGLAACSTPEPSPGVTEDTVTVGTHTPLTGPAAAGYSSISAATKAYFDYVNDNGGINGRNIEYIVKDDGYNPATTSTVVRELVQEDEVFAVINGLGTPTHSAVVDYLNENDVPDLFVASGSPKWDQPDTFPNTFAYNANYIVEAKALATYAQETWPDKTFCVLGQDDDFGTDFTTGLVQVLGADGLASTQTYSVSVQDVVAQVGAMQAAGCEVNFLATVNGFTALALGTAAKMKYGAQWVSSSSGGDYPTLVGYLGEDVAPLLLQASSAPTTCRSARTTRGSRCSRRSTTSTTTAPRSAATRSTGCPWATCSHRRWRRPATTRPARASSTRSRWAPDGQRHRAARLLDGQPRGVRGVGITVVDEGVQDYVDGEIYTTDAGNGPGRAYTGEAVALEGDGIPTA